MQAPAEEARCGKCWYFLDEEDHFCRRCGTKRGEGEFNPEDNVMEEIYGPPPAEYCFTCQACGLEWTESLMINFNKFCPQCGADVLEVTSERDSMKSYPSGKRSLSAEWDEEEWDDEDEDDDWDDEDDWDDDEDDDEEEIELDDLSEW
jgi:hypothetical protein